MANPTDAAAAQRSFVRSALETYGANLAGAVLSLVNVLIIARSLGAEGRGNVAFLTALAWLTASLATLGVQEANANFAASEPKSRPALATNSVVFSLLLGLAAVAVLAVLIELVPALGGESDPALRWVVLGFLPVIILQICLRLIVQADYAFRVTNLANLVGPVLNAAVNGLFALLGILSVASAVGVWLAGQALGMLILAIYLVRRLAGFGKPDPALAGRAIRFGMQAHVGRVMQLGNYRLDQVLIGAIAGPRELGLYSVAVAWAEALWFLPTALSAVQRPDLVRARRDRAAGLAARAFRATTVITAAAGLVMIAAAPLLCATLFGEEFRGSIDDLRVLVLGAFGMVALKLFGNALVAQGKPGLQSAAIATGFVLTVALDVILIPPLGGLGAALASALAYTGAGVVIAAIFLRALDGRAGDLAPRAGDVAWFWRKTRELIRRRRAARVEPEEAPMAPGGS